MEIKLKSGDKAPEFNTIDQNEKDIKLSDYRGKMVALFFYPKDNTPGCTAEACNLQENQDVLKAENVEILGCSPDSLASHQKFAEKFDITYPLLVDEDKKIIKSYGVWGIKKMYGREYEGVYRTTFLIDEEGLILDVITKVKTKDHSTQIQEILANR